MSKIEIDVLIAKAKSDCEEAEFELIQSGGVLPETWRLIRTYINSSIALTIYLQVQAYEKAGAAKQPDKSAQ